MNNVGQYVDIMKQTGIRSAENNPNSEMSMLKQELITHYKNNQLRAHAMINGVSSTSILSAEQRLHYDAAYIAINGYPKINTTNTPKPFEPKSELDKLKEVGWQELNKKTTPTLLNE